MNKFIRPKLNNDEKVVFIVIDCLRLDQWKILSHCLQSYFKIETDYYLSLLPTTTYFSRNAIFSGYIPLEAQKKYPEIWDDMSKDTYSYNAYEEVLFKNQLSELGVKDSTYYIKISNYKNGEKLSNKLNQYKNIDCLAIVINFIDILTHARLESKFIKEIVSDESAHRYIIKTWFENSWLF